VGIIDKLPEKEPTKVVFKLISRAGRKQITRESDASARVQPYALGPDKASNAEAGAARDTLLAWIAAREKAEGPSITKLYWDGAHTYWIESGGRTEYPTPLAPLEFRE
jgi:hypothetical protein